MHSYHWRAVSFLTAVGRLITLLPSQCGQIKDGSYQPSAYLSVRDLTYDGFVGFPVHIVSSAACRSLMTRRSLPVAANAPAVWKET